MRDLRYIFDNPFLAIVASLLSKLAFVKDALKRFQDNSPGASYNALVTQLSTAIDAFEKKVNATDIAKQMAATKGAKDLVVDFKTMGRELFDEVKFVFRKDKNRIIELFPNKLSEINEATKDDIPAIVARWTKWIADNADKLSAETVDEITDFDTNWKAATGTQAKELSKRADASNLTEPTWITVCELMFKLLVKLSQDFPGNPDIVDAYWNGRLVASRQNKDNDNLGRIVLFIYALADANLFIAKAQITIEKLEGTYKKTFKSNNNGRFRSPNLAIGLYKVTIAKEGFITQTLSLEVFDDKDPLVEVKLAE
jgi:hypothetical protein